eukprot:45120_1
MDSDEEMETCCTFLAAGLICWSFATYFGCNCNQCISIASGVIVGMIIIISIICCLIWEYFINSKNTNQPQMLVMTDQYGNQLNDAEKVDVPVTTKTKGEINLDQQNQTQVIISGTSHNSFAEGVNDENVTYH